MYQLPQTLRWPTDPLKHIVFGTGEDARDEELVDPTTVDAYWLQRRVSKCFPGMGAQEAQKLAEQAFTILQVLLPDTPR